MESNEEVKDIEEVPIITSVRIKPHSRALINNGIFPWVFGDTINNNIYIDKFSEERENNTSLSEFSFDHVYDEHSSPTDFYCNSITPIINSFLKGTNGCIILYGGPKSGKTYTVSEYYGNLLIKISKKLFDDLEGKKAVIKLSFIGLREERVYDLFERKNYGNFSEINLKEIDFWGEYIVKDHEDVDRLCTRAGFGRLHRNIIDLYDKIAQLRVETIEEINDEFIVKSRILYIVDLKAPNFPEGSMDHYDKNKYSCKPYISSFSLKNVLLSLKERKKVIYYRESKLTHILNRCLGGNCKVSFIIWIDPSHISYNSSLYALKFLEMLKSIPTKPRVNINSKESLIVQIWSIYNQLLKNPDLPSYSTDSDLIKITTDPYECLKSLLKILESDTAIFRLNTSLLTLK